ncbi:DUF1906 domain-containing protein [Streptomyces fructofermentans]|uniref:DUF1906 domain-containing protein n=1 Tax=Streptomyces fructofermentans TaxID=152141 RepID=UPI0033E86410
MRRHSVIVGLGFVLLLVGQTAAPPAQAGPRVPSAAADGDARAPGLSAVPAPLVFKGRAFDTCRAPSADTMGRWRASRYRAVGVYFGGRGRACRSQPNLSHRWMRKVRAQGWRVLPLYVGSQAPCVFARHKRSVRIGRHPWRQGRSEARDAVRRAGAIGIGRGSALYLDMEAYAYQKKRCARSTLRFVRGWDREVRKLGYLPGFYSSAESGIRHLGNARRAGVRDLPSVMWFARWRVRARVLGEPALLRTGWSSSRRIHQYTGNVWERHGGRTLLIDRNLVHAPVARIR